MHEANNNPGLTNPFNIPTNDGTSHNVAKYVKIQFPLQNNANNVINKIHFKCDKFVILKNKFVIQNGDFVTFVDCVGQIIFV